MTHIANFDGPANAFQTGVIEACQRAFGNRFSTSNEWA